MKARPLTFRPDMLQAVLDGKKTETRRMVKSGNSLVLPGMFEDVDFTNARARIVPLSDNSVTEIRARCYMPTNAEKYRVVTISPLMNPGDLFWARLPRAARSTSKVVLELQAVHGRRVKDMTVADARAEGIAYYASPLKFSPPLEQFQWLWDEINGQGCWEKNDWVWVYKFEAFKGNINRLHPNLATARRPMKKAKAARRGK